MVLQYCSHTKAGSPSKPSVQFFQVQCLKICNSNVDEKIDWMPLKTSSISESRTVETSTRPLDCPVVYETTMGSIKVCIAAMSVFSEAAIVGVNGLGVKIISPIM